MRQKILSYAGSTEAKYKARDISVINNQRLDFTVRRQVFTIKSPVAHNVSNALAAISCGQLYKISYNDIHSALARFRFSNARQEIAKVGPYWIIDDTYNANPLSLESAIRTLNLMRIKGKRIAVCGDMLELGAMSKVLHQKAGRMIAYSQTDVILTMGSHARYTAQAAMGAGGKIKAVHCDGLTDLHRALKRICNPGDAILVKGSRGMHLERTVEFLKKNLSG
jgi:UDP-N-acetylmuramyl pentapeptide synthase